MLEHSLRFSRHRVAPGVPGEGTDATSERLRADGSCDLGNTPAEGLTDALLSVYGAFVVRELPAIHKPIN